MVPFTDHLVVFVEQSVKYMTATETVFGHNF